MIKKRILIFILVVFILSIYGCKKNSVVENNDPETTSEINLNLEYGTVSDIDGNVYKTVKIGKQWWMAENLKVTKDPKGNSIESFCYNDDESNALTYGRLYSWDVAMNRTIDSGNQGIAPDGWHIPTNSDWDELMETLGGYSEAGGHLKSTDSNFWNSPNTGASNISGFSAIAAGEIDRGKHWLFGDVAIFWSSIEENEFNAYYIYLTQDNKRANMRSFLKTVMKYSIRCIKD